jgi:hypothetical protein
MLTREEFVVTDMGEPNNLEHSSWKAQAIRRGDLKISGPIPITEDMPLNEEEEIEFAETGVLLSPGQPQDELEIEEKRPQTPPHPGHAPPVLPQERAHQEAHHVEQPSLQPEAIPQQQPSRSPLGMHQVAEMPQESVVQPVPYSPRPTTPIRSTPESANKAAQKRKRKSGIRKVLRKMFGRKNKDGAEDEEVSHGGHSYHHSVCQVTCGCENTLNYSRILVCWEPYHLDSSGRQQDLGLRNCLSKTRNRYTTSTCRFQ